MKPAPFDYIRAATIEDAIAALSGSNGTAKVIAGGQSIVPMLNFRLVDAPLFVDINGIQGLSGVSENEKGGVRIGALTRHFELETSDLIRNHYPVFHEAMKHVAHLAIRNRGTIGGSLSHADPAAELPAISVLLDAEIIAIGEHGERRIAASDFFEAPLTTCLHTTEIVTAVELPRLTIGTGWGFEEFSQRRGDFAVAGVAAIVTKDGDVLSDVRIAVFGAHNTPLRAVRAEQAMREAGIDAAVDMLRLEIDPSGDLRGSKDYRRHLAGVLCKRALHGAMERAA
ncbi:MAG: carbon monoxide dehydrogenase [Pelagibacteraceae bacterium]|nr:carbon monoxide dehydrogenase [Pelagibacteraceae bacterium]PPR10010.1 MAG: 6-hydroxypseudooxynicotine dehydrogenase complex subunit alpha [Alphaproteobacteria bacterium MarineAlpha11_Bin1]|tara:strand:+ start:3492 stop:4343 length:852 start_codon:yes stop_codon:yes gene_type:complete